MIRNTKMDMQVIGITFFIWKSLKYMYLSSDEDKNKEYNYIVILCAYWEMLWITLIVASILIQKIQMCIDLYPYSYL